MNWARNRAGFTLGLIRRTMQIYSFFLDISYSDRLMKSNW